MWIFLALISAFFLGLYDVARKHALSHNAVIPVLFWAVVSGAAVFAVLIVWSAIAPSPPAVAIGFLTPGQHLLVLLKTVIVAGAWLLGYWAFKHLPISIAVPFGTLSPVFTIIGAVAVLGESFSLVQMGGMACVITAYYLLSRLGAREGIAFHANRWVWALLGTALLNSISACYDKFLVPRLGAFNVQAWFMVYMAAVLLPVYLLSRRTRRFGATPFAWRFSVPLIGLLLAAADFVYFHALADRHALIGVVETIRRSSVVITFIIGSWAFHESNLVKKGAVLLLMMAGIALLFITFAP